MLDMRYDSCLEILVQVAADPAGNAASYTLNYLVTGLELTINVSAVAGAVIGPAATLTAMPIGRVNTVRAAFAFQPHRQTWPTSILGGAPHC
jgi:hypothetical protein